MYISTRGNYPPVSASKAIYLGMVPSGGLFVPEKTPGLTIGEIAAMEDLTYPELAEKILGYFLDDYTPEEIRESAKAAYGDNFYHEEIAPVTVLDGLGGLLELYHGPTAAFKDMALQLTPRLLSQAIQKDGQGKELLILVATSGDTGKAALEGFKDVQGVRVACFFPDQGVSRAQELQMRTTDGQNTYVYSVEGNFDDCQNGVKEIFGDAAFNEKLAERGWQLSSANSINWGRLCPQIVYYFYAYLALAGAGCISVGTPVHFVVPTGNFGNILSAWYAREMGLPIGKLICASNENKVLTDFFATGFYDRRRTFYKTTSPSMDILISSNLERFLFEMNGHDGEMVGRFIDALNDKGCFTAEDSLMRKIREFLWAGSADEREGAEEIRRIQETYHYLMDTHTAVGSAVYGKYAKETGDGTFAVLDATASPYKFAKSVLEAISGETFPEDADELLIAEVLAARTGSRIHPALDGLDKRPVLHDQKVRQDEMKSVVESIISGTFGGKTTSITS
ncbi:MAG: threonine synthase [Peptococcaceae bacterium]|jgi:threonine synthase|nr:threonine synthase [Peptococcaceae bacterium]